MQATQVLPSALLDVVRLDPRVRHFGWEKLSVASPVDSTPRPVTSGPMGSVASRPDQIASQPAPGNVVDLSAETPPPRRQRGRKPKVPADPVEAKAEGKVTRSKTRLSQGKDKEVVSDSVTKGKVSTVADKGSAAEETSSSIAEYMLAMAPVRLQFCLVGSLTKRPCSASAARSGQSPVAFLRMWQGVRPAKLAAGSRSNVRWPASSPNRTSGRWKRRLATKRVALRILPALTRPRSCR